MEVVVLDDALIQPYSVRNIAVHAAFEGREDWIVEKVIIGTDDMDENISPVENLIFTILTKIHL